MCWGGLHVGFATDDGQLLVAAWSARVIYPFRKLAWKVFSLLHTLLVHIAQAGTRSQESLLLHQKWLAGEPALHGLF